MVCKLPLCLWLPSASGRRCARQVSRSLGTFFLRRGPFCPFGSGGCSQPSLSSLRIPNVFESILLYFFTRRARWLPLVCKLPLSLWLPSASGHPCQRQVSRSFGTFLLRRSPFCSLESGGRSQPSFSSSRILERFREHRLSFDSGQFGGLLRSASYP
jgi:hypothetical protein